MRPRAGFDLLVIHTHVPDACAEFHRAIGLEPVREQHGTGPEHWAVSLDDGTVIEIYPARPDRVTGYLRVDLTLAHSPLGPGRHRLTDPDGRTIVVTVDPG